MTPRPKNIDVPFWKRYEILMKRLLIPVILAILLFLGINYWWSQNVKPVSADKSLENFIIPKGYSAAQIGNKLANQKLIKNPLAFKIYVQIANKAKKIQAGEYRLSPSFNLLEIVDQLTKGPVEVWVTVPEGLRREEIAERFIEGFTKEGAEADLFRQAFLNKSVGKEGFLFPDTYLFPKTASASAIVNKMLAVFEKRVDNQMREDINRTGYSLKQKITLASIIERETRTNEERSIVAGILLKRAEANWPLQADASVQYKLADLKCQGRASCDWWPELTKEDLDLASAYNTYKFPGLPPGPIANPGLSSIKAAVYPQESPYWFYLHDSQGKIHYAKTLEEHNQNIRTFLGK